MLDTVIVTSDVMGTCWAHALTTEKEEIMGLLIGKMENDVLVISALKVIKRLTKQRDRVEFDNTDLIAASEFAESLPGSLKVQGWYHSHPHFTVHPSHVDLTTQSGYQMMDPNFVGLIFSVFNYDPKTNIDSKEVVAFQSKVDGSGSNKCHYVKLRVKKNLEGLKKPVLDALSSIPNIFKEEELDEYEKACKSSGQVMDKVYNQACFVTHVTKQFSLVTGPILDSIQVQKNMLNDRIRELEKMKRDLEKQLF